MVNLTSLYLSSNYLSGTVPSNIGNMVNLTSLVLAYNILTGTVPSQLGLLPPLEYLDLSFNNFTQSEADGLCALVSSTDISFYYPVWKCRNTQPASNYCSGSWNGVSCNGNYSITQIYLSSLGINGTIPPQIGLFKSLSSLIFSQNNIKGLIFIFVADFRLSLF